MAGFADLFNNFGTNLNTGIGNLTSTPLGQLGINLLMASGPQAGNPSGAARFGQAASGMQQMQMDQARLQQANQLRDTQAQEILLRNKKLQQEQDTRTALAQYAKEHPEAFAQNPMLGAMLGAGGDAEAAMGIGKVMQAGMPKMGAMPAFRQQVNPDNTVQDMQLNPQTMKYEPAGAAYTPTAQQSVNMQASQNTIANTNKDEDQAMKQQSLDMQRAAQGAAKDASDARLLDARRKATESAMTGALKVADLDAGYRGAATQIDQSLADARALLNDPALSSIYGVNGVIPNMPGSAAAAAYEKLKRFQAGAGLSELQRLKQMGIVLTPVSNVDLSTASTSAVNMGQAQGVKAAKDELNRYIDTLQKAKDEAGTRYNEYSTIYNQYKQAAPGASGGQATITRTGTDAQGRKVIQYSDGRIEYGN